LFTALALWALLALLTAFTLWTLLALFAAFALRACLTLWALFTTVSLWSLNFTYVIPTISVPNEKIAINNISVSIIIVL
jgi:hypothetical protein